MNNMPRKKLNFGTPWFEPGFQTPWVSFDEDPDFRKWDEKFIMVCNRCLSRLHKDLSKKMRIVNLVEAYDCWRVVADFGNHSQCKRLLKLLEEKKPKAYLYGQFGGMPYGENNARVIFYAENMKDRDLIFNRVKSLASKVNKNSEVFVERACQNFHRDILGDPLKWKRSMPVKEKENVDLILTRLENVVNSPARSHLEDHFRFRHE